MREELDAGSLVKVEFGNGWANLFGTKKQGQDDDGVALLIGDQDETAIGCEREVAGHFAATGRNGKPGEEALFIYLIDGQAVVATVGHIEAGGIGIKVNIGDGAFGGIGWQGG